MKTKRLKPVFGPKHRDYIGQAIKSTISVAEGAVRAGKTIDNIAAFAYLIDKGTPDRIHLATGSTAANAKLNIGDANGYGLEYIFRGRCRWTKYKGNEALVIRSHGCNYIVIFAGAAKADSYKKIRGNSYGMWIATEINLHHEDTIKEAFNRQLAARVRRIFWDLNPTSPGDWIYTDYINKFSEQFGDRYNYQHFTIRDNETISKDRLAEIEAQYMPGSIWYQRDILGERVQAQGLVYRQFAETPKRWMLEKSEAQHRQNTYLYITIGVDFGGNRSLTTFVATAIGKGYRDLTVLRDHHIKGIKGEIDSERVCREFLRFVDILHRDYLDTQIRVCFCDSEAQYLINGLRRRLNREGLPIEVADSLKAPITQRIACTHTLLSLNRLRLVEEDCPLLIAGLSSAVWDKDQAEKGKDVRLDNGSTDIDILDAFEYSFEHFMNRLLPDRGKQDGCKSRN